MLTRKLLPAVITLSLFYFGVGFIIYSFVPSSQINEWLSLLSIQYTDPIDSTNQLSVVIESVKLQGIKISWYVAFGLVIGCAVVSTYLFFLFSLRKGRKASDSWKTLSVTLSEFPRPLVYKGSKAGFKSKESRLGKPQRSLVEELLGFAFEHKDWFIGSGHGSVGLFEHTLSVMEKASEHPEQHRLLLIAAAAHDLGKVKTFEKEDGEWVRISQKHDSESAKILKLMPSWEMLPEPDRRVLYYAVKFEHNPESLPASIPNMSSDDLDSCRLLLEQLRVVDGITSAEEAKAVVEENQEAIDTSIPRILYRYLRDSNGYYSGGRDNNSIGFFDGNYIYLIEHSLRSILKEKLPKDQATALGLHYESRQGLNKGMIKVLELLSEQGLLVTQTEIASGQEYSLSLEAPLWDIRVGEMDFKAMIMLKPNENVLIDLIPLCPFEVKVVGPWRLNKAKRIEPKQDSTVVSLESRRVSIKTAKEEVDPATLKDVVSKDKNEPASDANEPNDKELPQDNISSDLSVKDEENSQKNSEPIKPKSKQSIPTTSKQKQQQPEKVKGKDSSGGVSNSSKKGKVKAPSTSDLPPGLF